MAPTHFAMVSASSGSRKTKKKNGKKSSKRKPVNMHANFNSKCSLPGARIPTLDASLEAISDAMFPSNDHHHATVDALDTGGFACGDFHLHRCGTGTVTHYS